MIDNKRYNRNRKIFFYIFLVFTVLLICFSAYQVLDYGATIMYAEVPGGWYDGNTEDVTTQRLFEEIRNVQLAYIRMLVVLLVQLVFGIIFFLCTKRNNS